MERSTIQNPGRKSSSLENLAQKKKLLFYDKMFSKINAIIFVFDLTNFRMLWVNDSFKQLLGYPKPEDNIPEEELINTYHPEDRDALNEMRAFFSNRDSGSFTAILRFRDASQSYRWLCTTANIFRKNADNKVIEITGVAIDITNQFTYCKNLKTLSREKIQQTNGGSINRLTKREKQILRYFANGYKTREVAETFKLSFHTINNHRKNILRKLGLKNLASLVNFAVENGLS